MPHSPLIKLLLCDHMNDIWWGVQSTKLLVMYSFQLPCHHVPFGLNYIPQRPLLEHREHMFVAQIERQGLTTTQKTGKITILYILIFIFWGSKVEGRRFCTKWHQAFPDSSLRLILTVLCSSLISNLQQHCCDYRSSARTACWFSNNVSSCYTTCCPAEEHLLPRHASCVPVFSQVI